MDLRWTPRTHSEKEELTCVHQWGRMCTCVGARMRVGAHMRARTHANAHAHTHTPRNRESVQLISLTLLRKEATKPCYWKLIKPSWVKKWRLVQLLPTIPPLALSHRGYLRCILTSVFKSNREPQFSQMQMNTPLKRPYYNFQPLMLT